MSETQPEAIASVEQPDVIEWNGEGDALLVERAGYEQRGLPDRVAEVDEQLAARGYGDAAAKRSKAAPKGVKGRTTDSGDQQTT